MSLVEFKLEDRFKMDEGDVAMSKFQNLNTAMANMNKVVGMYTAAAKMGM